MAKSSNARQTSETQDTPYAFCKKVLNREQLNEIIDMKEVKRLAGKKRGKTQIEGGSGYLNNRKKSTGKRSLSNVRATAREQKVYNLHMTLGAGSGLVFESSSVPKENNHYNLQKQMMAPYQRNQRVFLKTEGIENNYNYETDDAQFQKRSTLLQGNLEVCSELSFKESEDDDKFTSGFLPPTMKAAFATFADYQSSKAKDMFGFRRNTF